MSETREVATACMERRDGMFLVTFRRKGSEVHSALSTNPIEPGQRFTLRPRAAGNGLDLAVPIKRSAHD